MGDIIPAILPENEEDLAKKAGVLPLEIPFIHLDVLKEEIWTPIGKEFEAHLMLENPEAHIEKWIARGAKRIIVHELNENILKHRGEVQIGIAAEMDRPIEEVLAFATFADFIHLMSIEEIGAQGHPLDEKIFDRIRKVQEKFPEIVISVDGGISAENALQLIEAGADRLVVGSHFKEVWNLVTTK